MLSYAMIWPSGAAQNTTFLQYESWAAKRFCIGGTDRALESSRRPSVLFRAIGPQLRAGLRCGDRAVESTRELRWILRGLGPVSEAADVAGESRECASAHRPRPRTAFSPRSLRRRRSKWEQEENLGELYVFYSTWIHTRSCNLR